MHHFAHASCHVKALNVPTALQGQFKAFWLSSWRKERKKLDALIKIKRVHLTSRIVLMVLKFCPQFDLERKCFPPTRIKRMQLIAH